MNVSSMPVSLIPGIGPKKQQYLRSAGIDTIEDLIYYFPRDYEDRTDCYTMDRLPQGQRAGFRAMVAGKPVINRYRKNFSVIKVPIEDSSGRGWAVWFNNKYTAQRLKPGKYYDFFGKVERIYGEIQVQNPVVTEIKPGTGGYCGEIAPVYSKSGGMSPSDFKQAIKRALLMLDGQLEDVLPESIRKEYGLEPFEQCIKTVHCPKSFDSLHKARYRLAFEEFLVMQLGLLTIKKVFAGNRKGVAFPKTRLEDVLLDRLPFELTEAQSRAWEEISEDMKRDTAMNRLLQGDVGSGKTIVAVLSLVRAVGNGYQGALMAPTEILAEQHYLTINRTLQGLGIKTVLLSGSLSTGAKQDVYRQIEEGTADIVIGTHALIQQNVEYHKLGLVITDEQHRFGVRQRAALIGKGLCPDVLVMTATPIPRTLALILYGDMDISIIDRMPPGRKRVNTYVVDGKARDRAYGFVRDQLKKGRQAYVVCPLVEDSESVEAASALSVYHDIADRLFKGFRVGLIHGRLSGQQKESIMRDFRDKKLDMLVSTTVIEVGVNVPNANVMVVENAERFGLAQLHQLRGRVGRGQHQSYCILIHQNGNPISRQRMGIMVSTADGFEISEKDLMLRGPGDFFGIRQHGLPELKIASLPRDLEILKKAQQLAERVANIQDQKKDTEWAALIRKVNSFLDGNSFPRHTI
jgi:ATP-dependent DNA helicase RecG